MTLDIRDLDSAALTHDIPESGLTIGDVGTVVHMYTRDHWLVEFVDGGGDTVALLELTDQDIRPLGPGDLRHARRRGGPAGGGNFTSNG